MSWEGHEEMGRGAIFANYDDARKEGKLNDVRFTLTAAELFPENCYFDVCFLNFGMRGFPIDAPTFNRFECSTMRGAAGTF